MLVKRSSFFDDKPRPEERAPAAGSLPADSTAGGCAVYDESLSMQIECMREMCSELNSSGIEAALAEAEESMDRESFRAAVVGRETIGKNALINEILRKSVFPEELSDEEYRRLFGVIPTVIKSGAEDGITLRHGKIKQKNAGFPLTAEGWRSAAEYAEKNHSREVAVTVSETFLDGRGAELVRADLDSGFGGCDCSIVVMSAIQLLSERETAAVMELADSVPFPAAAVTHMDKLSEKDREQVCGYAVKKLAAAAPDTVLFTEGDTAERVRGFILDCRASDQICALKAECVRNALAKIGSRMMEIYSSQLSAVEERIGRAAEDARRQKYSALESTKETWDKIETQMLMKCADRFGWVDQKTDETCADLMERLKFEIEHTGNPKDWVENTYPYRMKQEMKTLMKSLEMNLNAAFRNDVDWLHRQVKACFGEDIANDYSSVTEGVNAVVSGYSGAKAMSDMKNIRLIARGATGAAAVISYIALAPFKMTPLGMGISIGGGIAADLFIGKKIEKQRQELIEQLGRQLPAEFDRRLEEVEKNLRALYSNAVLSAKEAYAAAVERQSARIDEHNAAKSEDHMSEVYNNRIEQLKRLKTEE